MVARGMRMVRPFTSRSCGSPVCPEVKRRQAWSRAASAARSAGTYHTGTPASFSRRKSVRASSCRISMCASISAMNGRNNARLRPSLYSSVGGTFDVATTTTPSSNRRLNRRPRTIASAMSVTWNADGILDADFTQFRHLPQYMDALVYFGHEFMEMDAALTHDRRRCEEQIHKNG